MTDPLSTDDEEEVQTTIRMSTRLYNKIKRLKSSHMFPSISDAICFFAKKGLYDEITPEESEVVQFTDNVTYAKIGNMVEQFNMVFLYYKEDINPGIELPELQLDVSFGELEEVVGVRTDQTFLGVMKNHADGITNGNVSKMFRLATIRGISLFLNEEGEYDPEITDKHMSIQQSIDDIVRDMKIVLERAFVDHRNLTVREMNKNPYDAGLFRREYDRFTDTEAYGYFKEVIGPDLFVEAEEVLEEVNYAGFYQGREGGEGVGE